MACLEGQSQRSKLQNWAALVKSPIDGFYSPLMGIGVMSLAVEDSYAVWRGFIYCRSFMSHSVEPEGRLGWRWRQLTADHWVCFCDLIGLSSPNPYSRCNGQEISCRLGPATKNTLYQLQRRKHQASAPSTEKHCGGNIIPSLRMVTAAWRP